MDPKKYEDSEKLKNLRKEVKELEATLKTKDQRLKDLIRMEWNTFITKHNKEMPNCLKSGHCVYCGYSASRKGDVDVC